MEFDTEDQVFAINSKHIRLSINLFQKGKYVNEKKDRVMVMQLENFTKLLGTQDLTLLS